MLPTLAKAKETFLSKTDRKKGKLTWREKHEKFLVEKTKFQRDVSFIGDSMISNFFRQPELLKFGGRPVNNFGIGGDKVENVLWRIRNGEVARNYPCGHE